jgi:flagellar basal body-associated protein FliL
MEIVTIILEVAIIPLLIALTGYLVAFIKSKTKQITDKTENDKVDIYINLLSDTVTKCVLATNQTYVEALKKDNAFTKEAQLQAFDMTVEAVMNVLTDDAKKYLSAAVGDLGAYIATQIEAEVNAQKK